MTDAEELQALSNPRNPVAPAGGSSDASELMQIQRMGSPSALHPQHASGLWNAIKTGAESSVTGLAVRQELPEATMAEDAPRMERIAAMAAQAVGDMPTYFAGGVAGGAAGSLVEPGIGTAIGFGAGGMALTQGAREWMLQQYKEGVDRGSISDRLVATGWAATKGAVVGGVTGPAGMVAGKLAGPIAATAAEIATMTTASAALEGRLPSTNDFIDGALMLGGLKGAHMAAGKLTEIFRQTGKTPKEVVEMATQDPQLHDQLVDDNYPAIPDALTAYVKPLEITPELNEIMRQPVPASIPEEPRFSSIANSVPSSENAQLLQARYAEVYEKEFNDAQQGRLPLIARAQAAVAEMQTWLTPEGMTNIPEHVTGTAENYATIMARRTSLYKTYENLSDKIVGAFENGDTESLAHMVVALDNIRLQEKWLAGASAEASRSLAAFQKIALDATVDKAKTLQTIVDEFGGTAAAKKAAEMLNEIKDNPRALARVGRSASTFQKFVSAWKLGLISGFRTAEVVWLSHLLYLGTRLSRDTVAGTLGSLFQTQGGLRLADTTGMFMGTWKGALEGIKAIGALYKSDAMDVFARSEVMTKGTEQDMFRGTHPAGREIGQGITYYSPSEEFAKSWVAGKPGATVEKTTVTTRKTFDPDNADQVAEIITKLPKFEKGSEQAGKWYEGTDDIAEGLKKGVWTAVENPAVQTVLKSLGYDSFNMREQTGGIKNLGVIQGMGNKAAAGVTAADLMGQEATQADLTTPVPFTSRLGKLAEMLTSKTHVAAYTLFRTMNERAEGYMQAQRIIREQGTWQYGEPGYWDAVHMLANNPTKYMQERMDTMGARGAFQEKQVGGIVQTINEAKMKHPWLNFIVPFTTVPGSIFRESARLSPFAPAVGKWREDFMAGGERRDRALTEFGAGIALTFGAWYMASNGNITGAPDTDPRQRAADTAAGKLPNSFYINGQYTQFQRMGIPGKLLSLVANVHQAWHLMDTPEKTKVWATLGFAFAHASTDDTWMKGLSDAVNAVSDPTRAAPKFAESFVGSVVPAVSAQTASEMDPYVRDVSGVLDAIRNRIPGKMFGIGRETLQPAYDIFGQPKANVMEGAVGPFATSEIAPDKVRTEASRLGYAGPVAPTAAPHSLPVSFPGRPADARMELTQEQRGNFAQTAGKQAYDVLAPQVNSPSWDAMPEMAKRLVYQKAFRTGHFRAAIESVPIEQRAQAIGQLQQEYGQ